MHLCTVKCQRTGWFQWNVKWDGEGGGGCEGRLTNMLNSDRSDGGGGG